jgi:hypothetical protein
MEVSFTPWLPSFDSAQASSVAQLFHPIWVQLPGLNNTLHKREYLQELLLGIGEILAIDDSQNWRQKTDGPRVRMLVTSIAGLPQTLSIPAIAGAPKKTYKIIYIGLPEYCSVCNTLGIPPRQAAPTPTIKDSPPTPPMPHTDMRLPAPNAPPSREPLTHK